MSVETYTQVDSTFYPFKTKELNGILKRQDSLNIKKKGVKISDNIEICLVNPFIRLFNEMEYCADENFYDRRTIFTEDWYIVQKTLEENFPDAPYVVSEEVTKNTNSNKMLGHSNVPPITKSKTCTFDDIKENHFNVKLDENVSSSHQVFTSIEYDNFANQIVKQAINSDKDEFFAMEEDDFF